MIQVVSQATEDGVRMIARITVLQPTIGCPNGLKMPGTVDSAATTGNHAVLGRDGVARTASQAGGQQWQQATAAVTKQIKDVALGSMATVHRYTGRYCLGWDPYARCNNDRC